METIILQLEKSLKIAKTFKPITKTLNEIDRCPFCLEDINNDKNIVIPNCGHKSHFNCFMKNIYMGQNVNKCCLCRTDLIDKKEEKEWEKEQRGGEQDRRRIHQEYLTELSQRYERESLHNVNHVSVFTDTRSVNRNNRNQRRIRGGNQRRIRGGNRRTNNLNLVINSLNREENNGVYLTINELSTTLRGRLGSQAIRRHINTLTSTNRVQIGLGRNGASNYRLARNQERHE